MESRIAQIQDTDTRSRASANLSELQSRLGQHDMSVRDDSKLAYLFCVNAEPGSEDYDETASRVVVPCSRRHAAAILSKPLSI